MIKAKKKPCDGESCAGALQYIWKTVGRNRYCRGCAQKINPTQKAKPTQPRKAISPRSSKQEKSHRAYMVLRNAYLAAHPNCEFKVPGICIGAATDLHHEKGRGEYLLDDRYFRSGCRPCHDWTETHPAEAKELGFSSSRLAK